MQSTKIDGAEAQRYPYLGVFTDEAVILFTAPHKGTVIHVGRGPDKMGKHSNSWAEEDAKPFVGKITLEN